jgi:hypothetical protein
MAKDKTKPIRCLMDATDLPPSAFALPNDGRKSAHKQNRRKALAQVLARRADPDGSNTRQSVTTMMAKTGMQRRTVFNVLAELRLLGFLKDGELHETGTRIRTLTLPTPMQDSGSQNEGPMQDSSIPMQDSRAPMQDRRGAHAGLNAHTTALDLPPIDRPLSPRKSAGENLSSYSQIARWLPDDMKAAQKRNGEKAQIDALLSEHGGAKFLAALQHHWAMQDPDSKLSCKWTAFLENFEGWLAKVTPDELQEQAQERWRKDHPEEWEQIQQKSMDRQTQELIARRFSPSRDASISEMTAAQFFGED